MQSITLPLAFNDDLELTCVACGLINCELAIVVLGSGRRVWAGLHKRCRELVEKRCTSHLGKEVTTMAAKKAPAKKPAAKKAPAKKPAAKKAPAKAKKN